jgi:hypothetical protein
MPGRGRSSFTKRLKERSRQEKQREKLEKKHQRKAEKQARGPEDDIGSSQAHYFEDIEDSEPDDEEESLSSGTSDA